MPRSCLRFSFLLLLCSLGLPTQPSLAQATGGDAQQQSSLEPGHLILPEEALRDGGAIVLHGDTWKYHPGDNPDWADPEFADSSWKTSRSLFPKHQLPDDWTGIGWFRLHLAVDSTLWNRPFALNVWQSGASEIHLDGRLLAQFGKVGSSQRDEEGYFTRHDHDLLPPPKSIVFDKANHVIAVRFSNFYFTEEYPWLEQGLEIGLSDLNSAIESSASQSMAYASIRMVFAIVPVVFAFLHLLLFLFYQRAKDNLYFAVFALMLGAWLFAGSQTGFSLVTDLRQYLFFEKLAAGMGLFAFLAGLRFLYALFYPWLPKQFWIFLLIAAGLGAWNWVQPLREAEFYFLFIVLTLPLEMLRVAIAAIWKKKDGAWVIGAGFIFFAIVLFLFLLLIVLTNMGILVWVSHMGMNFAIALLSSGLFGLLLSMSVFLSRNFARTNKNLETQLVQVKELSEEAIRQERERAHLEAENARKTLELDEARKLQLSMLPKTIPSHPDLDIAVYMQTATEVGGDYYDFDVSDDGTLTLAIGDATGHGMKAGTMVTAAKSLFTHCAREPDLAGVLKESTRTLKRMGLPKLYMALALARVQDHTLELAGAGMPPALVYRAATQQMETVALKGMPLGGPGAFPYQKTIVRLLLGDTVVLMSDGFPEMFNEAGEMLGYERAVSVYAEVASRSPEEIIAHLRKTGETWANGRAQDDDVTFVVMKVKEGTESG